MRKLIFLITMLTFAFGQLNEYPGWSNNNFNVPGITYSGNMVAVDKADLAGESLDEVDFATHAKWDVTNDFDDTGGNAAFVWSANQTSTLTQLQANLAIAGVGSRWYKFTYTVAVTTAFDGDGAATITTAFGLAAETLDLTAGTHTWYFFSAVTPTNFVISVVSGTDTEGTFSIDDVTLKEINGGDVVAYGTLGLGLGTSISEISIDGTMAGNSDDAVPTEAAIVTYVAAGLGAKANVALDNLASVAINTSLLSDTQDTDDLGSATKEWLNLYIGDAGKAYFGLGQDASIHRSAANEMTLTATSAVKISNALGVGVTPNNTIQVLDLINFDNTLGNTLIGYTAGNALTTGLDNTFIGYQTGLSLVFGDYNTAVGKNALYNQDTTMAVAVGWRAGYWNVGGTNLTALGTSAGYSSTGNNNTFVGSESGYYQTSGVSNTYVGAAAGLGISGSSVGGYNAGIGEGALRENTAGNAGAALGYAALTRNRAGNQNTGIGAYAGFYNIDGHSNTLVGYFAGYGSSGNSFSFNSIFGERAGQVLTTGSSNILIGYKAADNLTTGSNNIIIAYDTDAPPVGVDDEINIGGTYRGTVGGNAQIPFDLIVDEEILFDSTPDADHTASGQKFSFTAGETINFGDFVYQNADGEVYLADATDATKMPAIGMALETKGDGVAVEIFTGIGIARDDTWTWTVGDDIYLTITGTTGNTLSATAPVVAGEQVQKIGVATHADRILINISLDLITI